MLLALPLVLALMLGDHAALLLVLLATGSVSAAGSSTDAWVYRVNMCLFYAGWDG